MIALLLALSYLPATGHCLLESAGWLPSGGECCEESSSANGSPAFPCAYGCCPSEYAVYFSPAHVGAPLIAEVPVCVVATVELVPKPSPPVAPESSPPELLKLWQFTSRTALPPRAPSFVS